MRRFLLLLIMPAFITVSHALSATTPDDPNYEIQPQHWNSAHAASVSLDISASEISGLFSNANGVSFSIVDSKIRASVETNYQSTGNYLTTAALSNHSHGNPALFLTNITGTTASASNGLTLSLSGNAAQTVQTQASGNIPRSGFTTTTIAGSVVAGTHNTDGLLLAVPAYLTAAAGGGAGTGATTATTAGTQIKATLGTDGLSLAYPAALTTAQPVGNYLTTARASNDAVGLNTALTGNGVAWTVNSSGLSLNVPAFLTTAQPVGAYLTTARASNDAVGLNTALTANGVAWTVNSSGISLNVPAFLTTAQAPGAYLTTARASTDAIGLNTAQSNVTWTANSSGLSLDARGYAGTGTSATNASITLNSNGLAINVAAPGGATPASRYIGPDANNLSMITAPSNAVFSVNQFFIPYALSGTVMNVFLYQSISSSAVGNTYGQQWSVYMGIYSNDTAANRLVSLSSGSTQTTYTLASNSAGQTQLNGSAVRPITCPVNFNMTPGEYFIGVNYVTSLFSSGTATTALNRTVSLIGNPTQSVSFGMVPNYSVAIANTNNSLMPLGVASAASTGLPGSISYSQITMTGASRLAANFAVMFRGH